MSLLQQFANEATENASKNINDNPQEETIEEVVETTNTNQEIETPETPENLGQPSDNNEAVPELTQEQELNAQEDKPETAATKNNRFANEELARFNEFVLKTGKSWNEFQALNKPISEIDSKDLLKEYYSEKEGMSEKEISYELSNLFVDEMETDFDFIEDEKDQLKREAQLERELRKAREWREKHVSDTMESLKSGSDEQSYMTIEDYQEKQIQAQKVAVDQYRETIYKALPDIKTMEVEVNGQKVQYTPDKEFNDHLKAASEDFGTIVNQYYDASGNLKDASGWIDLVSWTDPNTRNAKIKFIVDQAIAHDRAERSKERRNVSSDNVQVTKVESGNQDEAFDNWRKGRKTTPFG